MNWLHFDCFSGMSGDMTLAALIDVGAPVDAIEAVYQSFGLPIRLETARTKRSGISGLKVTIHTEDQTNHRHLPHIEKIFQASSMTEPQKRIAIKIFHNLAVAEAKVHQIALEKVHFHEVGALDSIADIAGVAVAVDLLGITRFTARSIPTGSGMVQCDHGLMPIPAPATAELLIGIPLATSAVKAELTTPTGAAILKTLVSEFTEAPAMTVDRIGNGAGHKDFPGTANILRVFLGRATPEELPAASMDTAILLETNLDDASGEVIGYTVQLLLEAKALDVWTTAIQMKKQRPGTMLSVLCRAADVGALEAIVFRETGTFGIRRQTHQRHIRTRSTETISTSLGAVRVKTGSIDGQSIRTPEYEDCARLARETGTPLREIVRIVHDAIDRS